MKSRIAAAILSLVFCTGILKAETVMKPAPDSRELIQIAILLDASNSMDGLIDQAKTQLWKIVNELALAKRNGTQPKLEVAFYEYGKSTLPSAQGYIRKIVPLSTDLDKISDELFKLTTNGGDEYCGQVIRQATAELAWSKDPSVMKAIFIAGNEPFTQGSVDYAKAVKEAVTKGIVVNTIFCGTAQEGIDSKWKAGAELADGSYMSIDQNRAVAHINAPQDSAIAALGVRMNATYVSYGDAGVTRKKLQAEQDLRAMASAPEVMVQRSVAKASAGYSNGLWDLVDAKKEKKADIAQLQPSQLPEEMKTMTVPERQAYVDKKAKEREEIQAKISRLNEERRTYVDEAQKKLSVEGSLDQVITSTIRKQAMSKGFTFSSK
jgi:hypothetical protein